MPEIRHQGRNRMQTQIPKSSVSWRVITTIALAAVIVGGYWLFKDHGKETLPSAPTQSLPKMANMPKKQPEIEPPPKPTYAPDAPVIEQARQALREGVTPADAVVMAAALPEQPGRADAAFLLLEYAAESGNAEAAMAVGEYYDPSIDLPSGSIRKNAARAFEWYQVSLAGGRAESGNRLANLRRWVVARAEDGAADAQALLKTWP